MAESVEVREVLSDNIGRIRRLRGMTVRDVSARLKELGLRLSASGVSEIENAVRKVSVDELLVIAIALNTSVIDLLSPADGSPLALAQSIEPLEPMWLELWLQGMTPWPQEAWGVPASTQLEAFLATASEYRRAMHRRDTRPEIAAIDGLRERVLRVIEALEDPAAKRDMPLRGMSSSMRSHLEEVDAYTNLLANRLEKSDADGG
jgi:transcriptional regulator with XRE-family HTH domain